MNTKIRLVYDSLKVQLVEVKISEPPPPGYQGSPTVLINGFDIDPAARDSVDFRYG